MLDGDIQLATNEYRWLWAVTIMAGIFTLVNVLFFSRTDLSCITNIIGSVYSPMKFGQFWCHFNSRVPTENRTARVWCESFSFMIDFTVRIDSSKFTSKEIKFNRTGLVSAQKCETHSLKIYARARGKFEETTNMKPRAGRKECVCDNYKQKRWQISGRWWKHSAQCTVLHFGCVLSYVCDPPGDKRIQNNRLCTTRANTHTHIHALQ